MNVDYNLASLSFEVIADYQELFDYLSGFYSNDQINFTKKYRIIGKINPESNPREQAIYLEDKFTIELTCTTLKDLMISTRMLIRELYLVNLKISWSMIHASAASIGNNIFLFVGEKGVGKTTSILNLLYEEPKISPPPQIISNDHLLICDHEKFISLTTIPTLISIKPGSYLKYSNILPSPFDGFVDIEKLKELTPNELKKRKTPLYFTMQQIFKSSHFEFTINPQTNIFIILLKFNSIGSQEQLTEVSKETASKLLNKEIRSDWLFGGHREFFLPNYPPFSQYEFMQQGGDIIHKLIYSERCQTFSLEHGGGLKNSITKLLSEYC